MTKVAAPKLFNTPFETGIRSVVILDAVSPACLSLDRLIALDHLVVHSSDIGGPESLHPAERTRAAEMLVRRALVEKGIYLMMGRGLVERIADRSGITYCAGEEAAMFVHLFRTPYAFALRERARWLSSIAVLPDDAFSSVVNDQMENWALQFQPQSTPGGLGS